MLTIIWEIGVFIIFISIIINEDFIKSEMQFSNPPLYELFYGSSRLYIFFMYLILSALWPVMIIMFILNLFNQ